MLSQVRYNVLVQGQSAIARRVLAVVPITEWWSANDIHAELARTTSHRDREVTGGCLRCLVECGLVRERSGHYLRSPVRPQAEEPAAMAVAPAPIQTTNSPAPIATRTTSPTDRLGEIAARVRAVADDMTRVAEALRTVAGDVEYAALEIEDTQGATAHDLEQLRILRGALAGLALPRQ